MVRVKILIVEDEGIVALNIQNRVESLGYEVVANVPSGEAAVQRTHDTQPDLVLMDIKLQGNVDGIEAATQIRRHFQIPVVYLTAYTDSETLNRAKLTEPYGYILKPFESRDLHSTIEIALYKYQMEQQLHKREQLLATTLKSIGDAVITTDANGLVTFINSAAEMLTRWRQEEVLGKDLTQVFQTVHQQTREVLENPVLLALRDDMVVSLANHALLIAKDGTEIPIDDSAAPIKDEAGQLLGAVLVFHDIIERQRVAALMQRTNEKLERQVAQNTAQLQETNQQLQIEIAQRQRLEDELRAALEKERELNALKSRIVATVSHEYRTPLTVILSSTELLEQYGDRLNAERKQQHFQRIQASVRYLTRLIDDVTLIDQIDMGELDFNPALLKIEPLAEQLIQEFQVSTAGQYSIHFECQGECPTLQLDAKLLESMLWNLLSNAVKYSPPGGSVLLELVCEPIEVILRISDQGLGIPAADQGQIFNAFFRSSNVGTIPGVGLGLVLVKAAVDLHGGRIVVDSEAGVGTTVTVTLPLLPTE